MKKWFSVVLIAMLSACSIQGIFEKQDVSTQFEIVKRRVIEKHKVPQGIPDGEFSGSDSSYGRTFKTFVKHGYIDKYFDIYHPNGKLHSHTVLVDGIAQGWSFGYTPEGILRTKLLYKDGAVIEIILLDEKGNVIQHIKQKEG
ncbi:toxin-antitoxin system YwqK family antitoxin [Histophilus somni]|uniref:toxin-antitoxin system YwqK family antitoxin n=1 Tax=Histophilus somni TaxID=731 RepID=UPI000045D597|nr:hypothetical protein [Histophilus somni]ACA31602.1 conserved hypothetical protein [Histophilus somni 2336]